MAKKKKKHMKKIRSRNDEKLQKDLDECNKIICIVNGKRSVEGGLDGGYKLKDYYQARKMKSRISSVLNERRLQRNKNMKERGSANG